MTAKGCLVYIDGGRIGADDQLRNSAAHWGWPVSILPGPFKGWGHRVKTILAAGPGHRTMGYTHLLIVDPYDTAMIGPPEELDAALAYHDYSVVLLACEAGCWPDAGLQPLFGERKTNWWFPHSQVVIDLRQPLPFDPNQIGDTDDDQRFWTSIYLNKTPSVTIDRQCLVVQSAAHSQPFDQFFEIRDSRLVNRQTGSKPLLLHGNGGTDLSWFQPIIRG